MICRPSVFQQGVAASLCGSVEDEVRDKLNGFWLDGFQGGEPLVGKVTAAGDQLRLICRHRALGALKSGGQPTVQCASTTGGSRVAAAHPTSQAGRAE
jgi:hypothetical protein